MTLCKLPVVTIATHVLVVVFLYGYRGDIADNHQPNLIQQLTLELRRKGMFFSKNCIQLSKVVGQGMYFTLTVNNHRLTVSESTS